MKKLIFTIVSLSLLIFLTNCKKDDEPEQKGTFTDSRDGKIYEWVNIGNQTWMAENLAYKTDTGCWAQYNDDVNIETYGYLYVWNKSIESCPDGWHLPSKEEWETLIDFAGGYEIAGGKLKQTGTHYWSSPNEGAVDSYGFRALPGGYYNLISSEPTFELMNDVGAWWSSSEDNERAFVFSLEYYESGLDPLGPGNKDDAFSIRCIKN